jgi:hypothetical protein
MVSIVVKPEGTPGPAGIVYVMTSSDAVERPGLMEEPGSEPLPEGATTEDAGTVTVRG